MGESPAAENPLAKPIQVLHAWSNLLLTGPPGIGKTTVIVRLVERLNNRALAGFYTDEVRANGQRRGFRVTTFSGRTGTLPDLPLSPDLDVTGLLAQGEAAVTLLRVRSIQR